MSLTVSSVTESLFIIVKYVPLKYDLSEVNIMINKLSVMVADIDGTLCPKGENLMPKTRAAIQRLHREGVLFGPASGRPFDHRTLEKADEWGLGFPFDLAIGMNGGELYDRSDDSLEKYYLLKKDNIRTILSLISHLDLNAIIYVNGYDEIRALRMDDFLRDSIRRNHSHVEIGDIDFLSEYDTGKIEVHLRPDHKDELMNIMAQHPSPDWTVVKTFEGYGHVTIEFVDPRINKGLALQKFSEKHQIPLSEFMAFGDMENDIGLLREAGWGVCLINGADDTKAVAQAVTEYPVTEDGVGNYLETHWFSR